METLENWNISSIENINSMLEDYESLASLKGLQKWDISNVTDLT